ncbi:hypothetical protein SAMN03159444_00179 [Pseudomonas sp. NFACC02]|uniref:hypothetical protein n=1 Tax=Pseudomonas sp. NFACC02 TaxID=1566250 RepID=UPI0008D04B64|nr:hypothetical protein [Pseudomonas sp. NFACC02]SEP60293.1 hypothetical protein SAMN03159444_00179 [Pseudomonas sp. NFACC02]
MSTQHRSHLLMAGLFTLGISALFASSAMSAQTGGSALPPGVNPSSPAGGNGGDAQGYEKKPVNPEPTGSHKKATDTPSPGEHPKPSTTDRRHSTQKKAATAPE